MGVPWRLAARLSHSWPCRVTVPWWVLALTFGVAYYHGTTWPVFSSTDFQTQVSSTTEVPTITKGTPAQPRFAVTPQRDGWHRRRVTQTWVRMSNCHWPFMAEYFSETQFSCQDNWHDASELCNINERQHHNNIYVQSILNVKSSILVSFSLLGLENA